MSNKKKNLKSWKYQVELDYQVSKMGVCFVSLSFSIIGERMKIRFFNLIKGNIHSKILSSHFHYTIRKEKLNIKLEDWHEIWRVQPHLNMFSSPSESFSSPFFPSLLHFQFPSSISRSGGASFGRGCVHVYLKWKRIFNKINGRVTVLISSKLLKWATNNLNNL